MKQHHEILIIGGGTGGIMVAAQLLKKNSGIDVAIMEPSTVHAYQPAWTLVGAGSFRMSATQRKEERYIPQGATWIRRSAKQVLPEENTVVASNEERYTYDQLVVTPGLVMDLEGVEGLKDTIGKNGVCSNYIDPEYTWEVVRNFKGGNALFTQAATPIKCGGAPQKAAYLSEEYFQKSGVRDKTNVIYALPGSVVFGVEGFKQTIYEVVDRKNIIAKTHRQLVGIDPEKKLAHYRFTGEHIEEETRNDPDNKAGEKSLEDGTYTIPFDMLHLAPPQRAPEVVRNSPLAFQDGANKGWMEVDTHSLQHPRYPNVFGVGDCVALPTAKTGASIRKQAPVVVENILSMRNKGALSSLQYSGYASCPLVTGYGKMVLAEFEYDNKPAPDPLISKFLDTTKESWWMWMLKKYGLPWLYWHRMLRGKM